jgi:hypothetical protein
MDRGDVEICIFSIASRLTRDPTNLFSQWVRGGLSPGRGEADHLRVMPMLRMHGAMRRLPLRLRGELLD